MNLKKLINKTILVVLLVLTNQVLKAQYCVPPYGTGCTYDDRIELFELNTLSNYSGSSCSPTFYEDYTSLGTATVTPNQSYNATIKIGNGGNGGVSIWIDYNDNQTFETNERVGYDNLLSNATATVVISLPISANPGVHRLRIRQVFGEQGSTITPCDNYTYGETEDYQVFVQTLPPCAAAPSGISAITNYTQVCVNTALDLSISGAPAVSGVTYQWQKSVNSGATWSNIGTAQLNYNLNINQSVAGQYRSIATCTSVSQSFTTNVVSVAQSALNDCYCTPDYLECGGNDYINDLTIGAINDATITCLMDGYGERSGITGVKTFTAGQSYPYVFNLTNNSNSSYTRLSFWVDANQNGVFDTYEHQVLSTNTATSSIASGNITIPVFALSGLTRIRVKYEGSFYSEIIEPNSCISNGNRGVAVDYIINMVAAPSCSNSISAGIAVATETSVCTDVPYQLVLNNYSQVSGLTFQWQKSLNGTTGWANIGNAEIFTNYSVPSQSVTNYYRNVVTCTSSSATAISNTIVVNQKSPTLCYCTPNYNNCQYTYVSNVAFANLNDAPICNNTSGHTQSALTASVTANQTYTFTANVTAGGNAGYVGVWIDYDQSGTFDQEEFIYIDSTCCTSVTNTITIPYTATGGVTGIRINLLKDSYSMPSFDPCYGSGYDGQYLDYFVHITPVAACAATPNAGIAVSSTTLACFSNPFTLNITGNSINNGIKYQWQKSSDNTAWTNMGSLQSNANYSVNSQSTPTYYRCISTCLASSQTSTSTPILVSQNGQFSCYCVPPPTSSCANEFGEIINVTIANLNKSSGCGVNAYTNYSDSLSVPTLTLTPGNGYSLTITSPGTNPNDTRNAYAWIDFDHSGTFDNTEYFSLGQAYGTTTDIIKFITIPVNAQQGLTKMRIRQIAKNYFNSTQACYIRPIDSEYLFTPDSETEDYTVFFTQPDCSSITLPNFINSIASQTLICAGSSTTLDINPAIPNASGFTFQWYQSTDDLAYTAIGSPISTSSITLNPGQATYYKMTAVCNTNTVSAITTETPNVLVNIKPNPTVSITANTPSVCVNQTVTLTANGANSYLWNSGQTTNTIAVTPTITTAYSVVGTSTNSCNGNGTITLTILPATAIEGTVTATGSPVAGKVILFKYEPQFTKFDTTAQQAISANGSYNFPSIANGTYIVLAVPSQTNQLQITYGLSGLGWKNATLINHTCNTNDVQNVNVVPFAPITPGPGLLSGKIIEGVGFGQKPTGTLAPLAPGSPIGGITVKGGKNPGGNFFTQTTTDAAGGYTLSSLPINTAGEEYFILVDIPGLDTNGTYERQITSINNEFIGLDFIVDNEKINPIIDVSVNSTNVNVEKLKVYPNPVNDNLTIEFNLTESSVGSIMLTDVLGRTVLTIQNNELLKSIHHLYSIPVKNIESGIYFLQINMNDKHQTIKIIINP